MKNKLFTSTNLVFPPPEWLRSVEEAGHVRQGGVWAIAPTKAVVEQMLEERLQFGGRAMAKEMRLRRPPYSTWAELCLEAKIFALDVPGVYATSLNFGRRGDKIARIEPDGAVTVVGVCRIDPLKSDHSRWIEPV